MSLESSLGGDTGLGLQSPGVSCLAVCTGSSCELSHHRLVEYSRWTLLGDAAEVCRYREM